VFDFEQVGRDEMLLALGGAIGIGVGAFATTAGDPTGSALSGGATAVVAGLTVLLVTALD